MAQRGRPRRRRARGRDRSAHRRGLRVDPVSNDARSRAWAGLGAAVVLAGLAAVGLARPGSLPRRDALVTGSAAALLVAGLSLPWQRACYARSGEFGAYAGHCVPTSAWTSDLGVAAALLALGAVVLTVAPRRFPAQAVPACGAALLVGILALQLEEQRLDGVTLEAGPGWVVGAVGAALLLAATFGHARPRRGGLALPTARLVPAAACAAYIVIVALPWSNELPQGAAQALGFAPVSWLTIAGVVLALALLQLWVAPRALAAAGAASVALLPVAMLALAAVELLRLRDDGLNWGRGGVAALCLLLAALGRIEQRGGLERFELPGALRVDRL